MPHLYLSTLPLRFTLHSPCSLQCTPRMAVISPCAPDLGDNLSHATARAKTDKSSGRHHRTWEGEDSILSSFMLISFILLSRFTLHPSFILHHHNLFTPAARTTPPSSAGALLSTLARATSRAPALMTAAPTTRNSALRHPLKHQLYSQLYSQLHSQPAKPQPAKPQLASQLKTHL